MNCPEKRRGLEGGLQQSRILRIASYSGENRLPPADRMQSDSSVVGPGSGLASRIQ